MDTYYESAEGTTITKSRALKELSKHKMVESEVKLFFEDMGDKEKYNAQKVLAWLGY